MRPDAELIIIGAGLAGLLLAERLAVSGQRRMRVELVEQAASLLLSRRSWSWYEPGKPGTAFNATWPRWEMSSGYLSAGRAFAGGRYGLLRGEAIAARAEAAIASSQSVVFRRGLAVTGIHAVPGGTRVETPEGGLTASLVIDTRPGGAELMNRGAWVRTGVRAEVHTGSACFEAGTAHLVHRLRRDGQSLAFETILPLAPDHAVVEAVRIARPGDALRPDFDRALEQLTGGLAVDTGPRMRSASPLGLPDRWPSGASPARLAASRGAGLAIVGAPGRDAQRALTWAGRAYDAIERGDMPPGFDTQPLPARLAGRLLLGRLAGRPSRLVTMAERTRSDAIIRAVNGAGTLGDALNLLVAGR